jgi:hypothetical protein
MGIVYIESPTCLSILGIQNNLAVVCPKQIAIADNVCGYINVSKTLEELSDKTVTRDGK